MGGQAFSSCMPFAPFSSTITTLICYLDLNLYLVNLLKYSFNKWAFHGSASMGGVILQ
jgi:hypothetical protein